jgi:crossover junction endodeoxyribonuclease RuvC
MRKGGAKKLIDLLLDDGEAEPLTIKPKRAVEPFEDEAILNAHYDSAGPVVGIDPGQDGAIAVLNGQDSYAIKTPTIEFKGKTRYHAPEMVRVLRSIKGTSLVILEKVTSNPKYGHVMSAFTFGIGFGMWLGILAALELPHQLITPQLWKKTVLAGTAKDKQAAIEFALRRYPQISLLATPRSKKPHDGIADAICLAEYGRQLLLTH